MILNDKNIADEQELIPFQAGWDAGNYGNAYENEEFVEWNAQHKIPENFLILGSAAYSVGCLVGFYTSYEDCEIPKHHRKHVVSLRNSIKIKELLEFSGISS